MEEKRELRESEQVMIWLRFGYDFTIHVYAMLLYLKLR